MITAFIRISSSKQLMDRQRLNILDYAQRHELKIDRYHEVQASRSSKKLQVELKLILQTHNDGDIVLVDELSRLGERITDIIQTILDAEKRGIRILFTQQEILNCDGDDRWLMISRFAMLSKAEIEIKRRRSMEGQTAARLKGRHPGRPKGSKNRDRYWDRHRGRIQGYLDRGITGPKNLKTLLDTEIPEDSRSLSSWQQAIRKGVLLK